MCNLKQNLILIWVWSCQSESKTQVGGGFSFIIRSIVEIELLNEIHLSVSTEEGSTILFSGILKKIIYNFPRKVWRKLYFSVLNIYKRKIIILLFKIFKKNYFPILS